MGLSLLRPRVIVVSVSVVVVECVVRRLMGVGLPLPLVLALALVLELGFGLDTNVVSPAADDVVASDADVSVAVVAFPVVVVSVAVVGVVVYVDSDTTGQVDNSVGLLASKRPNSSRSRLQQQRHMRGISNAGGSSSPIPVPVVPVDKCDASGRESASRSINLVLATLVVDFLF